MFKPKQKRSYMPVELLIDNMKIDQVYDTPFLEVVLDENITWKLHNSYISSKISKCVGIIFRSSFYFFKSSLKTLCYGLVYPLFSILQYCLSINVSVESQSNCCITETNIQDNQQS